MELSFKEQANFSRVREDLFGGDESYRLLQYALMQNSRAGVVIPGTSGARKVRWAEPTRGKGKRGGIRVIYFYHEERSQILFLFAYDKKISDLTPGQRKDMADAIYEFRRECGERDTLMQPDFSKYQLLPDDEDFEDDETMDSAEFTRNVVEALKEATRQARQEKRRSERLVYDEQDDSLLIRLADGETVRTVEMEPGVLFNYDAAGQIVSIDLLHASQRIPRQEERSAA